MTEIAFAPAQEIARRGPWQHVAVGSIVTMVALLGAIMAIVEEIIPPVLIMMAVTAVAGVLLLAFGRARWPLYLSGVIGFLLIAINVPFLVEDLAHPETFFSFVPGAAVVATGVVLTVAGFAGGAGRADRLARPLVRSGTAAVAVAVALSALATLGVDSDQQQPGDIAVVAASTDFPEHVEATAGNVAFFVDNEDRTRHTFVIEGQDVKVELPGNTARRVEANLAPGEYRFYCDVPGHEDLMEGTLIVSGS